MSETVFDKIERYKKMSLNEQLDDWFGDQKTFLRGLCCAECISRNITVTEIMINFEYQCYKADHSRDFLLGIL